ncbi:MAG: nucleotidyltransferase domain-containing protein [Flavobacterium sp.]|nr:nucleotidyltransferase domain-containing protein [Flavobacterium sp.]
MKRHSLKKEIDKITKQIIRFYKPQKIVIFGSSATGKKTGDIDMLIVKETKEILFGRMYKVKCIANSDKQFDPIVLTPGEVRQRLKMGDFFIKDILTKGKLVYES